MSWLGIVLASLALVIARFEQTHQLLGPFVLAQLSPGVGCASEYNSGLVSLFGQYQDLSQLASYDSNSVDAPDLLENDK